MRPAWLGVGLGSWILFGAVSALTAQTDTHSVTAQVTLTSDYVYRGLSQSLEDPAIQGGFQYRHQSGLFAGVWASSVDFPANRVRDSPRDLEVDLYAGYGFELSPNWSGTALFTSYNYPGDDPNFEYDYLELSLSVQYREWLSASVYASNDILGAGETALAYELAGRVPLSEKLEVAAGLGHFDLDNVIGGSYSYWNLGLSYFIGNFDIDVNWIDTSNQADRIFGSEVSGGRFVASLTAHIE